MKVTRLFRTIVRHTGDAQAVLRGPGSPDAAGRLARGLGGLSIGTGLAELLAPRRIAKEFGLPRAKPLPCAFSARDITSGIGHTRRPGMTGDTRRLPSASADRHA